MSDEQQQVDDQENENVPSFLGSWNRVYAVVLGFLLFLIVIFYLMTISLA